jgi:hypothetical protein
MARHVSKKRGPTQKGLTGLLKMFCKLEKCYLVLVIRLVSIVPHFYHILDVYKC